MTRNLLAAAKPRGTAQSPSSATDPGGDESRLEMRVDGAKSVTRRDAAWQAFVLLRTVFTIAPIVLGADKFFNILVDWSIYLTPHVLVIPEQQAMYVVGVIEIVAGVIVAVAPRWGAPLVAVWLGCIIVNLIALGDYYDVAFRDFGLLIGAVALWRLATAFSPANPFRRRRSCSVRAREPVAPADPSHEQHHEQQERDRQGEEREEQHGRPDPLAEPVVGADTGLGADDHRDE